MGRLRHRSRGQSALPSAFGRERRSPGDSPGAAFGRGRPGSPPTTLHVSDERFLPLLREISLRKRANEGLMAFDIGATPWSRHATPGVAVTGSVISPLDHHHQPLIEARPHAQRVQAR